MASASSVRDITQELRRRRLIPDLTRIQNSVLYGLKRLEYTDILRDVGVQDMSVLHLRLSVLGGSQPHPDMPSPGDHGPGPSTFTRRRGKFPSSRPDVWTPEGATGKYTCNVCPAFAPVGIKKIAEHEQSTRHSKNLKREDERKSEASGPSRCPPVLGPLNDILRHVIHHPAERELSRNSWVNDAGVVDWGSDFMDVDAQLQAPLSVQNAQFLTERLHAYLNEPAVEDNSEDEADERSETASVASREYQTPHKTRRVIDMDNDKTEWFPWPDKETCVLDILRHIPRCSFSKKQNAAIHWAMSALGVHDLPSDRVMDDIDKALQPLCGIQSIRYSGKLMINHVYYVNDLAAIIAQEMANPSAWQASRWRHELDPDLATPMIRIGAQDFFTLEPTVLRDGTICMPSRWFKRGTDTWAEVWMMRQFNLNGVPGWLVDNQTTYEIKSSDLLVSFPDFINTYVHRGVPDPRIIHGLQNNPATFTDWTSTDPSKGNRWRLQAVTTSSPPVGLAELVAKERGLFPNDQISLIPVTEPVAAGRAQHPAAEGSQPRMFPPPRVNAAMQPGPAGYQLAPLQFQPGPSTGMGLSLPSMASLGDRQVLAGNQQNNASFASGPGHA
ncbi:hypothetical protein FB45DRAFT_1094845 [Roridomyces roridus]|uniref:Uncharacterized protein n=1 Tax=Roridomyces roridus TaxID=1738132 RepID=A0AAD7AXF5_9AGAR|nr:hypothetical protein FB45DRAFT_1094845 [Roridomyces roridus]